MDGGLTKISEDLLWEYNTNDWMQPWRVRTPATDRVDLTFTPCYDRAAKDNLLVIRTEVHQLFGTYAGRITTAEGQTVTITDLFGWAEEHRARW